VILILDNLKIKFFTFVFVYQHENHFLIKKKNIYKRMIFCETTKQNLSIESV